MDTGTILAMIGTAATVAGVMLGIMSYRDKHRARRPAITVRVYNGFHTYGPDISDLRLFIEAANTGEKPVTLSSWGFKLPDGRTVVLMEPFTNVTFPHELLPGKNCSVAADVKDLARSLAQEGFGGKVKLIGFYRDQLDNEYRSPTPFNLDLIEWAK